MATSDYANVSNVILAGTSFMRLSYYVALTHLAQDFDVTDGFSSPVDVAQTAAGEHSNLILQALCRGRVRKSDGARCLPMSAYIVASIKSGIGAAIPSIFPGCAVQSRQPFERQPRGKQVEALHHIETALAVPGCGWVSYRDTARAMNMDWRHFRSRVTTGQDWPSLLASRGLEGMIGPQGADGVHPRGVISS